MLEQQAKKNQFKVDKKNYEAGLVRDLKEELKKDQEKKKNKTKALKELANEMQVENKVNRAIKTEQLKKNKEEDV